MRAAEAAAAAAAADEEAPAPPPLVPGVARALSPLVRRIVAPNPGKMTGAGTNTYLVGIDEIAVIDPGPVDDSHLEAVTGCGGDRIRWILCTHTHPDHAPGAAALKEATGAEVLAFGSRDGSRSTSASGRVTRSRPPSSASPPTTHRGTPRTTSASSSRRSGCCSPATTSCRAPRS